MSLLQDYEISKKERKYKKSNNLKDKINNFLEKSKEFKEFELQYILLDKENLKNSTALAFKADEIIEINPFNMQVEEVAEWAYDLDTDFFKKLEEGKTINYISMQSHFNIWTFIENYYPDDIEYKKGTQIYLKYCKQNKITKMEIDKGNGFNDTPNVMRFYKGNKDRQR